MAEETGKRLKAQKKLITAYLSAKNINARAAARREAVTKRSKRFADVSNQGKGKGDMIKSVFKTAQLNHNIGWARRADGSLADTPDALGEVVKDKFEQWFKSVISVEGRWGEQDAWEKMLAMDTSGMDDTKYKIAKGCQMSFKDLVTECYVEPGYAEQAEEEGWWDQMLLKVENEEVANAIKAAVDGTAPGESQVTIGMLKSMAAENISVLTDMFNKFLTERRIPDEMNTAMIRLLPKTDAGLSDLDKTRPIVLMETLGKLYERVIIGRIMKAIDQYDIIDPSQYGAMPKAGTAPPLRALAEVLDDARLSKSELHVLALDLSKAFDTCEYWSQAMSWKALGMPDEVIKILINMDAGSNSPADPHEGPGATTSVILDAGRMTPKFAHGRGVRQGSVGGPIKWVVFMHFWLTWIKSSMRGKGYTMAKARGNGGGRRVTSPDVCR